MGYDININKIMTGNLKSHMLQITQPFFFLVIDFIIPKFFANWIHKNNKANPQKQHYKSGKPKAFKLGREHPYGVF
tara:strand:- start:7 stop:234 length:228 start_codon:yes stop_codon:yes gene_type:complete